MNPFAFFLAIADKVRTALNLLDPTRTYAAADALWEQQRGAERLAEKEAEEEVAEPVECDGKCATAYDFHVYGTDNDLVQMLSPMEPLPLIAPLTADEVISVRQLLAERFLSQSSAAPASQTDAPGEASGVPEGVSTPDPDATSGHLTLGNDPQSVHERALRQRREEDRGAAVNGY
jgi:hypothetical protein